MPIKDHLGRQACVLCGSENLEVPFVVEQKGEPPGTPSHDFVYSHVVLVNCKACHRITMEKLDHDCFDFDGVFDNYEWYVLDEGDTRQLLKSLKSCRNLMSGGCDCKIHNSLRSSLASLPERPWSWGLEHEAHVHRIGLEWGDGLPRFKAEPSGLGADATNREATVCPCLDGDFSYRHDERYVGTDRNYADIFVRLCKRCGRYWLHYRVEYEAFPRSGRWFSGIVSPQIARSVSPDEALRVFEGLGWYYCSGSYFDSKVHKSSGPVPIGPF